MKIARRPNDLIAVAQAIQERLGPNEFRLWLQKTVGAMKPNSRRLVESINQFDAPIATTNYDTLIERVLGRESTTWKEPANMQLAISGAHKFVMHLHGIWSAPDTVIFGSESYGAIKGNSSAQFIQELIGGGTSMLFIGASGTLDDPNLSSLIARLDYLVPESTNKHYLLCTDQQFAKLKDSYAGKQIVLLSCGPTHDGLPAYLDKLAAEIANPPPEQLQQVSRDHNANARGALLHRVRLESPLIANDYARTASTSVQDLLIPPILLPAPHEDIIASLDEFKPGQTIRCNPVEETEDRSLLMLVGDETSGLTGGLEWLLLQLSGTNEDLVPVLVDFTSLTSGSKSLERLVRRQLGDNSPVAPAQPLNNIALAVDNVPGTSPRLNGLLNELKSNWISVCYIGCKTNHHSKLLESMRESDLEPRIRYLGQVTKNDTLELAKLAVGPERAPKMAAKVYSTIEAESLSRTPLTVALLLNIFAHTTLTIKSISSTSLLDLFVDSLLGRGDLLEDSRVSIDAREREAILAALAEHYCVKLASALSETDVVKYFEELFSAWGWNESPSAVLENLKSRHILRSHVSDAKMVSFAQTSYLYLFAAKRAAEDIGFRDFLLTKPLIYAPVLTHYAALVRNDPVLLSKVADLIDQGSKSVVRSTLFRSNGETNSRTPLLSALIENADDGTSFRRNFVDEAEAEAEAEEEAEEEEENDDDDDDDDSVVKSAYVGKDAVGAGGRIVLKTAKIREEDEQHLLYMVEHRGTYISAEPFPTEDIESAPEAYRAAVLLNLVSQVLRDSELVRDSALKVTTLTAALRLWAEYVYLLETDAGLRDLVTEMVKALGELVGVKESKRDAFEEFMAADFPLLMATQEMNHSLASRKLELPLKACIEEALGQDDLEPRVMGTILAWGCGFTTWPSYFVNLAKNEPLSSELTVLMLKLVRISYLLDALTATQIRQIEEFVTLIIVAKSTNSQRHSLIHAKRNADEQVTKWREMRAKFIASNKSRGWRRDPLRAIPDD
ncbi:MAG: hypothetical protein JWR11_2617 [Mycobacterium sp.]|nr:hypothetical protein [Mycobacterium sp.]